MAGTGQNVFKAYVAVDADVRRMNPGIFACLQNVQSKLLSEVKSHLPCRSISLMAAQLSATDCSKDF